MSQRVYIQELPEFWVFHAGEISVTIKCKPSSRFTAEALAREIDIMLAGARLDRGSEKMIDELREQLAHVQRA